MLHRNKINDLTTTTSNIIVDNHLVNTGSKSVSPMKRNQSSNLLNPKKRVIEFTN